MQRSGLFRGRPGDRRCLADKVPCRPAPAAAALDTSQRIPVPPGTVAETGRWDLEIVKRSDLHRFVVLPKRWIVERTFA